MAKTTISIWYKNAFFIAELNLRRLYGRTQNLGLSPWFLRLLTFLPTAPQLDEDSNNIGCPYLENGRPVWRGEAGLLGPTSPEEAVWKQAVSKKAGYLLGHKTGCFF